MFSKFMRDVYIIKCNHILTIYFQNVNVPFAMVIIRSTVSLQEQKNGVKV